SRCNDGCWVHMLELQHNSPVLVPCKIGFLIGCDGLLIICLRLVFWTIAHNVSVWVIVEMRLRPARLVCSIMSWVHFTPNGWRIGEMCRARNQWWVICWIQTTPERS